MTKKSEYDSLKDIFLADRKLESTITSGLMRADVLMFERGQNPRKFQEKEKRKREKYMGYALNIVFGKDVQCCACHDCECFCHG